MINTLEKKLIEDYWIEKLASATLHKPGCERISHTSTLVIEEEQLGYFLKITSGKEIAKYTVFLTIFSILKQQYFNDYPLIFSKNTVQYPGVAQGKSLLYSIAPLTHDLTFKHYLKKVKEEVQNVYKYVDYEESPIIRKTGTPLEQYTPFGLIYSDFAEASSPTLFSLVINTRNERALELCIHFSNDFTEASVADHFLNNFKTRIENLEHDIDQPVSAIPMLSGEDYQNIIHTFNNTETIRSGQAYTIVDLFEEEATKSPNNTAVVFEDQSISYGALNSVANQMAAYLRAQYAVGPNEMVGIKLERNLHMMIAVLGVLKSGAAYVPIDMNYPQERIDYIEKDSNSKVIIDREEYRRFEQNSDAYSREDIVKTHTPEDLAYIIYTSGTTGNPKGVMITHRNASELILWAIREFNPKAFDITYAATSYCFDLSIFEMFYTLAAGKKLRLLKNALEIENYLAKDNRVLLNTVPSVVRKLIEDNVDLSPVTVINMAGEALSPAIVNSLIPKQLQIRNLYGPSEDTTYTTCYLINNDKHYKSVPIGKPITNTKIYILNDNLRPVPIGVVGKIYVSGAGVSKGYLNRPELTAEKFINDPFRKGEKMYNTGDLAKWMSDGNIAFLGREDHQVKLRGYRIELGEIEHAITTYSDNMQQAVVAVKNIRKQDSLIAYFVCKSPAVVSELRNFLQKKLPEYMIPTYFVPVDAIPLTPNGKTDIKALLQIDESKLIRKKYVAPRNATEKQLVEIWKQVLGTEEISITDNFFELGGHSLVVAQVINRMYKTLGKTISYSAFFANPTVEGLSNNLNDSDYKAIPGAPESTSYPLTPSQKRLWILSQMEMGSIAYNMPAAVKLTGSIDIAKFEEAFIHLIERHEILRTYFRSDASGILQQYIVPASEIGFTIVYEDFSDLSSQQTKLNDFIASKNSEGFDLEKAPLLRASILKLNEKEHLFFLTIHHIISDGWSIELLIGEVMHIYNHLLEGKSPSLPELKIQFKDYAVWFNNILQNNEYQSSEAYWLQQFEGTLPVLELPNIKDRPLVQTYNGATVNYYFSSGLLSGLKTFSRDKGATLFMLLMAGINALFHRYTGQKDIILGTPVAGREHPDLEHQMGLYLNTLAIRTKIEEKDSLADLLDTQKKLLLAAYQHQKYPFDELVSKLNVKKDPGRSALFDVMVVLQNQAQLRNLNSEKALKEIQLDHYDFDRGVSQFDLSFTFVESDELELDIEYNTDIYDRYFIDRMFMHLEQLFKIALQQPELPLPEIDFLTIREKEQLLNDFSHTKTVLYAEDKTVIDFFEEHATRTPDNIAVLFEDCLLTYKELDQTSNQLARYLRETYTIRPDDLVGVKLERSEKMIIAVLGILKSGAAYVPIDVNYPPDRIAYIEENSNAKVIIDGDEYARFEQSAGNYSHEKIAKIHTHKDLAYIIYTSGTTGHPKGVMGEHASLLDYILTFKDHFNPGTADKIIQQASLSFDTSLEEIFISLTSGSTLIIMPDMGHDIPYMLNAIERHKATMISTTPMVLNELNKHTDQLKSLKVVISGGDVLLPVNIDRIIDMEHCALYNTYGPSESTVCITYNQIKTLNETSFLGQPIPNREVFILNTSHQLCPVLVPGELCVSGAGLARGYLNNDALTKEKFIDNPYRKGEKMYKTGDLARWLPDGNIEFMGRIDTQVKIRGYRVELGEVESIVSNYSGMQQVAAAPKKFNGENILVLYYVSDTIIEKSDLRNFLQEKLPYYMIPGFYVPLEAIPLSPNGKIDRKALPDPETAGISLKTEYIPPTNETERKLIAIWEALLGAEKVGIKDNFFELGGNSMQITVLYNKIKYELSDTIKIVDLFTHTTVESQAILITSQTDKEQNTAHINEIEF